MMAHWADVVAKIKSEAKVVAPQSGAGANSDVASKMRKRLELAVAPGLGKQLAVVARKCLEQPYTVKDKLVAMEGIKNVWVQGVQDGLVLTLTAKGEKRWTAAKEVLEELFVVKAWAYIVRHVQTVKCVFCVQIW